jgi:hypothetical protein
LKKPRAFIYFLCKESRSFLFDYVDKVVDGTIPAPLFRFGKVAPRQFSPAPVVLDTFTTQPFSAAAKRTVTGTFVMVNITGFCSHLVLHVMYTI